MKKILHSLFLFSILLLPISNSVQTAALTVDAPSYIGTFKNPVIAEFSTPLTTMGAEKDIIQDGEDGFLILQNGRGLEPYLESYYAVEFIQVVRVKMDGIIDNDYGKNGYAIIKNAKAYNIIRDTAGNTYVFGTIVFAPIIKPNVPNVTIWKLTPSGELDTTFGVNGVKTLDNTIVTDLPNATNFANLELYGGLKAIRLNAETFGFMLYANTRSDFNIPTRNFLYEFSLTDGSVSKAALPIPASGYDKFIITSARYQPNGRKQIAGTLFKETDGTTRAHYFVARYTPANVFDTTFSGDGFFVTNVFRANSNLKHIFANEIFASEGQLIIMGEIIFTDGSRTGFAIKHDGEGAIVTNFGNLNNFLTEVKDKNNVAAKIVGRAKHSITGKHMLLLSSGNWTLVGQFNPDLTLDRDFNNGQFVRALQIPYSDASGKTVIIPSPLKMLTARGMGGTNKAAVLTYTRDSFETPLNISLQATAGNTSTKQVDIKSHYEIPFTAVVKLNQNGSTFTLNDGSVTNTTFASTFSSLQTRTFTVTYKPTVNSSVAHTATIDIYVEGTKVRTIELEGISTPAINTVWRFYNAKTQRHFYTATIEERDIVKQNPNWTLEGSAFTALTYDRNTDSCAEGKKVYRFWHKNNGVHFYTINAAEKDGLIQRNPQWQYEGVAYCAYESNQTGSVPLYRFYSNVRGSHIFTASETERQSIINNFKDFTYEGIGYYVKSL